MENLLITDIKDNIRNNIEDNIRNIAIQETKYYNNDNIKNIIEKLYNYKFFVCLMQN